MHDSMFKCLYYIKGSLMPNAPSSKFQYIVFQFLKLFDVNREPRGNNMGLFFMQEFLVTTLNWIKCVLPFGEWKI